MSLGSRYETRGLPEAKALRGILRPIAAGFLIGLFMGFVDSYGYAVSGYTVAEIDLVVIPVIARLLLGRSADPREIFIATVTAFGISLSTVITSGMLITYYLTSKIYWLFYRESDFPGWLYSGSQACFPNIFVCEWPYTYLSLAALSLVGVGFAYILRHVFLDKLNLPYPLGMASAMIARLISLIRTQRTIILVIISGIAIQMILIISPPGSLDLTPVFTSSGYGILASLSFDLPIFLIALLLPPRVSVSIGGGSIVTGLILLPIGASLYLYRVSPGASSDNLVTAASWYLASIVFGTVFSLMLLVARSVWAPISHTARTIIESRRDKLLLAMLLLSLLMILALAYLRSGAPGPSYIFFGLILMLIIVPLLIIITSWGAGEAGTVSQAFYPTSTVYMYLTGYRGFAPYVYMDHYLGIPMPSSLSASSLHILRASRILGISPTFILSIFSLSFLIGSLITIYYGYLLINIYGNNPERMPLDRWIPYTLWSLSVYRGELDSKSILPGAVIGVLVMMLLAIVDRLTGKSFSPIPFIIGLTLTTDLGILFILGSFLRWFVSKFGGGAEKQLMIVTSSLLAGVGIAITIYTVFNAIALI
ncbi:MAG: hypothetical protein ACO2O0_08990 [Desulfurococcales archaeon]|jgi:hypothetical protein